MTVLNDHKPEGSFETQRIRIDGMRGYFLRIKPLKTPQNRNGGGLLYLQHRLNTPVGEYTSAWLAVGVLSKEETKRRQIAAQKAEKTCRCVLWTSEKSSLVFKTSLTPLKNMPIKQGEIAPSLVLTGNSVEIQRIQIDGKTRIALEATPLETSDGTPAGANLFAQNQIRSKDGWQPSFWTHIGYLNEFAFVTALQDFKKKVAEIYPPNADSLENHLKPDTRLTPPNLRERKKTLGVKNLICRFQNHTVPALTGTETNACVLPALSKKCHEKS